MTHSLMTWWASLALAAAVSVGAILLMPVPLPSVAEPIDALPDETAVACCSGACCVEVRINADSSYTWIESDCSSGRVCRVVTGQLRPKRSA